jgi:putative membrane protein
MKIPKLVLSLAIVTALVPVAGVSQSGQPGGSSGSSTERQGQSTPSARPQTGTPSGQQGNQSGRQPGASAAQSRAAHSGDKHHSAEEFVKKAAHSGMAEVELAKMAQDKASNSEVKQFAAKLAQDHTKANEELKEIATKNNWAVSSEVDPIHRETKAKFAKLSGSEFDREYIREMLADHRKAVTEFKWASENAENSDLKQFASKALPTLQQHLDSAQELHAKLEGGGAQQQPSSRGSSSSSPSSGASGSSSGSGQYGSGSGQSTGSPSGQQGSQSERL